MRTVQLNIPLGYKIEEEKRKLPVEQARELLLTKKQKKYTRADRDDYTVELTSHFIRCPHCNYKIYVYARELNRTFGCRIYPDYRVNKEIVLDWTSQQMSIFPEERKPLFFSQIVNTTIDLTCPNCKNTMHHSDKTRLVELRHENHKVYIRAEVLDIMELFSLPCLSSGEVRVEFPLFEVACFNFRNGHSYIRLETPDGRCLAVRDLTSDKYAWTSGSVYNAVSKNKYVRRIVRNMFNDEWNSKIPFCPSELGVNEMRMLTMFVGYDREFYSAIPFAKGSLSVDDSFKIQARKMRDANDIVSLYEKSKLPNMKSIKKILFDNEGLFFYLEECERLWELFSDPNHFVTLLKEKEIYQILSDLHMRPMIFEFLADYLKTGRKKHLLKLIHKYWHSLCRYAVNYGSMSKHMRKSEQICFRLDEEVFTSIDVPSDSILCILESASVTISGLKCSLIDERQSLEKTFVFPNGLVDYAKTITAKHKSTAFYTKEIETKGKDRYNKQEYDAKVKVIFGFSSVGGFTKCIHNYRTLEFGGRHIEAVLDKVKNIIDWRITSRTENVDLDADSITKKCFIILETNCSPKATNWENATKKAITNRMIIDMIVNLHIQSLDQTRAIKTIKSKLTDIDRMKIEEQKKAVRAGYDDKRRSTIDVRRWKLVICR